MTPRFPAVPALLAFVLLASLAAAPAYAQDAPARTALYAAERAALQTESLALKAANRLRKAGREASSTTDTSGVPERVVVIGVISYAAGAVAGWYVGGDLVPPSDTSRTYGVGHVVGGFLGGAIASATAVHIDPAEDGPYWATVGAAVLYPVAVASVLAGLRGISYGTQKLFGWEGDFVEGVAWIAYCALLGAPVVTPLIAHEVETRY